MANASHEMPPAASKSRQAPATVSLSSRHRRRVPFFPVSLVCRLVLGLWALRPPRAQTFGGRVNREKKTRAVTHPPVRPLPGFPRSSAPPIALASVEGRRRNQGEGGAHLRPARVAVPPIYPSMI
jgi:hypothetical protein